MKAGGLAWALAGVAAAIALVAWIGPDEPHDAGHATAQAQTPTEPTPDPDAGAADVPPLKVGRYVDNYVTPSDPPLIVCGRFAGVQELHKALAGTTDPANWFTIMGESGCWWAKPGRRVRIVATVTGYIEIHIDGDRGPPVWTTNAQFVASLGHPK